MQFLLQEGGGGLPSGLPERVRGGSQVGPRGSQGDSRGIPGASQGGPRGISGVGARSGTILQLLLSDFEGSRRGKCASRRGATQIHKNGLKKSKIFCRLAIS